MSEQAQQRPQAGAEASGEYRSPQEVDEELQEAMRREAATRETTPADEQVTTSGPGTEQGMGPQGAGHGRRSHRHS